MLYANNAHFFFSALAFSAFGFSALALSAFGFSDLAAFGAAVLVVFLSAIFAFLLASAFCSDEPAPVTFPATLSTWDTAWTASPRALALR